MRAISLRLCCSVAATLLACAGAGTPGVVDAHAPVDGLWRITISVVPRAYMGTLTIAAGDGGALSGVLAIVAPATVDATLRGSEADGTLTLSGPYTAGSGCKGTMTIAVRGSGKRRSGPAELVDGCVGKIDATATLSR